MARRDKRGDKAKPRTELHIPSLSFFGSHYAKEILDAYGVDLKARPFRPNRKKLSVWGRGKPAMRALAKINDAKPLTLEDGFVRSLHTGREGESSQSLIADGGGIYFDPDSDTDLRHYIEQSAGMSDEERLNALNGLSLLKSLHLSKYNKFPLSDHTLPKGRFVVVIDQTRDDAAVRFGGADAETFRAMLAAAKHEFSNTKILIKTHPEAHAGQRKGYFSQDDLDDQVSFLSAPISPWILFSRARAVYCVTSQMGMEAIFAGHRPKVFGRPVYAGWGLTDDRNTEQNQYGIRSAEQLFWAAYLKYTLWFDPFARRAANFETVAYNISTAAEAWRADQQPAVCLGFRAWKRGFIRTYLQTGGRTPRFAGSETKAVQIADRIGGRVLVWAGKETDSLREMAEQKHVALERVEDGFLRSKGLGAALTPPVSLCFDDLGIYYDPGRESRLERLIATADRLPPLAIERAGRLRERIVKLGLSKYNLDGDVPQMRVHKGQEVVLVPGQVEDDASIRTGTTDIATNEALIWAARQRYPDAYLIYKPHPDVEAGLRSGAVRDDVLSGIVDLVAREADINALIEKADIVATMTSLTGFEALMRGKRVVTYGAPFYAGWGLTEDLGDVPARRGRKIGLDALVHATLIDYPRYWDPITSTPCPPEAIVSRFEHGLFQRRGKRNTALAKLQGLFAGYAFLWRR